MYCRPKGCFYCTCIEVLTPVDQLKPGDKFALHQSPTVHCDLCMPWKKVLMAYKWNYYGQDKSKK